MSEQVSEQEPSFAWGYLRVEYVPLPGSDFQKTAYEVYEHVRTTGRPLSFTFNGVSFTVQREEK